MAGRLFASKDRQLVVRTIAEHQAILRRRWLFKVDVVCNICREPHPCYKQRVAVDLLREWFEAAQAEYPPMPLAIARATWLAPDGALFAPGVTWTKQGGDPELTAPIVRSFVTAPAHGGRHARSGMPLPRRA